MSFLFRRALVIFLVALFFRVAMLVIVYEHPERMFVPDSYGYVQLAINILKGNGFSLEENPPYTPSGHRTPVYPLFIAWIYAVSGENPLGVAIVQVLISAITPVLAYFLGLRLFSERAAWWGGLLLAISLGPIVYSVFILTETLFTLLLSGAVLLMSIYRDQNKKGWIIGGGVLTGMAILCRPVAIFYPLTALFLVWLIHRGHCRQFLSASFNFLVGVTLVITPWIIRNTWSIGYPTLTTTAGDVLFLYAVALEADLKEISYAQAQEDISRIWSEELLQRGEAHNETLGIRRYGALGAKMLLANPGRYLYIHLKNDLYSFLPNGTEFLELLGVTQGGKGTLSVLNQKGLRAALHNYFGKDLWLIWPMIPWFTLLGIIYIACVIGIVALLKQRQWFIFALLFLPVMFLLLIPGPLNNPPRFRVPAMPYVCLLAGAGLAAATSWAGHGLRKKTEGHCLIT